MPVDQEHIAHPRLYGAPAYARPPRAVPPSPMPLDPDDLPLAVAQTPDEQAIAQELPVRPYQVVTPLKPANEVSRLAPGLESRPLLLRTIAGRILRRAS